MPRLARLDAPGVFPHIMIRGIEHRKIFRGNRDRENFLERLGNLLQETKRGCYSWAFLPNHLLCQRFKVLSDPDKTGSGNPPKEKRWATSDDVRSKTSMADLQQLKK